MWSIFFSLFHGIVTGLYFLHHGEKIQMSIVKGLQKYNRKITSKEKKKLQISNLIKVIDQKNILKFIKLMTKNIYYLYFFQQQNV